VTEVGDYQIAAFDILPLNVNYPQGMYDFFFFSFFFGFASYNYIPEKWCTLTQDICFTFRFTQMRLCFLQTRYGIEAVNNNYNNNNNKILKCVM
jgi:hypothetical protein